MYGIKEELKRIGILSKTKIKWESVDDQCKVTITGTQENCNRANALIKEVVVSVYIQWQVYATFFPFVPVLLLDFSWLNCRQTLIKFVLV